MKWYRVYGIVLRFMYLTRVSFDRATDIFYWPILELLLWGITSLYFRQFTKNGNAIVLMIVSGILFWLIIRRVQNEISVNLLEDLWNKNLINLFVAPLRFSEWIMSFIVLGLIKTAISLSFALVIAYFLFKVQFFFYGFYLIPFSLSLIITGWWVGFLITGIILRYGTKIQTLSWTLITILSPFSGVYYPLSILPKWAQEVAVVLPTSYIFEGARQVLNTGTLDSSKLLISFSLNFVYLILSMIYLRKSFNIVLQKGLVNLY